MIRTFLIAFALIILNCKKAKPSNIPPFSNSPQLFSITPDVIYEASGIADSYANPGFLWVEQDSGNPPELTLIKHDGTITKKIFIKNSTNRDWEEMQVSNGPDPLKKYVYIGEIGDNDAIYNHCTIYRFIEPSASVDTIINYDKIDFKYSDMAHDAEAMLIDPSTKDIYIITKRDLLSKIYKIAYPQSTSSVNVAEYIMDLPYKGVVASAISGNGKEILMKTYSSIYYYKSNGTSIPDALKQVPISLSYQVEPQGEAVCMANDNSGFFTLSEKSFAQSVKLNFYKRN